MAIAFVTFLCYLGDYNIKAILGTSLLFSHSSHSTNAAFGTPGDRLSTRYRWVPLRKINFWSITFIKIGASLGWSLVILIDQHWGMIWDDLNGVTMYFPDCVRLGHGHSVFVRQLGLHRLPGLHGPNSLSSGIIM